MASGVLVGSPTGGGSSKPLDESETLIAVSETSEIARLGRCTRFATD